MYLFYDTETSGLPNFNKPANDISQPYVLQLAAMLVDQYGYKVAQIELLIDNGPDIVIHPKALETHGISKEKCQQFGVTPAHACSIFSGLASRAEIMAGHNVSFDDFLMSAMYKRLCRRNAKMPDLDIKCTLEMAKPILKIPATERMIAAGFGDEYKTPNLGECYQHFFGKKLEGAHDATVDVIACKEIFFKMRENELNS